MPERRVIYTWGYGDSRTFEDLLNALPEELRRPGWTIFMDVRRSRGSRNPSWHCGDRAFPPAFYTEAARRQYVWLYGLGTSGEAGPGVWLPAYGEWLRREQMLDAAREVRRYRTAVLICAEQNHRRCHRTQVAALLAEWTGAEVVHL
jgi:uncharacterized protein (DUF488 family)